MQIVASNNKRCMCCKDDNTLATVKRLTSDKVLTAEVRISTIDEAIGAELTRRQVTLYDKQTNINSVIVHRNVKFAPGAGQLVI